MRIDRSKLRKSSSEAPVDCKALIEKLKSCAQYHLKDELSKIKTWICGKCELYHWIDVLDIFDVILKAACEKRHPRQWCLPCDGDDPDSRELRELLIEVLQFTALLIEHSFSRHFYNSMEHLTALLSSSDMSVVLAVLNLLFVFSKRSNFITRLNSEKRQVLLSRLLYLAENWGGKENGFGLADCCQEYPITHFPSSACTLHFEYYDENATRCDDRVGSYATCCIHIDNVDMIPTKTSAEIMEELLGRYAVSEDKQMQLFTHLRLAHCFSKFPKRLQCVQARLQALSVLVYCSAVPENVNNLLYTGLLEELVDVLELKDSQLFEIKSAALRTLTSIIHFNRNPAKLTAIIDATGATSYHGFLPTLVRNCIQSLMDPLGQPYPQAFATAIFSFLYHLASYESGGEALVSCGMMESLLKVIEWHGTGPEHIHFVTRAVRVIDMVANLDMQAFQAHGGLKIFIDRLKVELDICRRDDLVHSENAYRRCFLQPKTFLCDMMGLANTMSEQHSSPIDPEGAKNTRKDNAGSMYSADTIIQICTVETKDPSTASTSSGIGSSTSNFTRLVTYESFPNTPISHCFPQRAAMLKSILNFLKKAIQDPTFSEQIRHIMDSSLPRSLVHIIGFAEYYGPSLFYLATEVVTVYVFQEPTLLTSLQDYLVTDVILKALLEKEIPASREVLSSLPNVFSALCLNARGLNKFLMYKPFEKIFKVLLSPQYLPAMRKRRTSDPMSDTASKLGNAMDELMRHQPSLRSEATVAIIKLLEELCSMGRNPHYVCSRPASAKQDTTNASNTRANNIGNEAGSSDEDEEEDDESDVNTVPGSLSKPSSEKASEASGSKTPVPLVDYILNVMRFVDAILSNNSTDDHCREFVRHRGLTPLMGILGLPNLPIDFPVTATCQATASVCKSILNLAHDPQVLKQGLLHLNEVLQNLEPLHWPLDFPGGSVLLEELVNAPNLNDAISSPQATPLLHQMAAAHAYIIMFIHVCRTSQSDIRAISISNWGSDLGLSVLRGLSKLYTSLVWESTVLLALCGADEGFDPNCQFGRHQLDRLFPKDKNDDCVIIYQKGEFPHPPTSSSGASTSSGSSAMDVDDSYTDDQEPCTSATPDRTKSKQFQMQIKQIKPLLSGASRLGRALAELFGLLVKLCVGSPMRQRRNQQIPASPSVPTPSARAVANALAQLLAKGLSWEPPPTSPPMPKFRLTFLICSVGFTSPMLFDERKLPYHLMLQMFMMCGGQDTFFDTFRWALTCGGKIRPEDGIEHPDLPDGTAEFLDAWLMLLEKMVNPKTVLESTHIVPHKPNSPGVNFEPACYLARVHKRAFDCIMYLWGRKPLRHYGERMTESMLTILCHLLKGEPIIREKLLKADGSGPSSGPSVGLSNCPAAPLPRPIRSARLFDIEDSIDQAHLTQLTDMGFSRSSVVDALLHTNTVEQATEYLLNSGGVARQCSTLPVPGGSLDWEMSEDDQMIRAIAMSLGENVFTARHQDEDVNFIRSVRPQNPDQFELKVEEPLSALVLSKFSLNLLPGCLKLLHSNPETVYWICNLLVVAAKKNGDHWRNDILRRLLRDIEVGMEYVQVRVDPFIAREKRRKIKQTEIFNKFPWMPHAVELTGILHLFTLLFEELLLPTACLVEESYIIHKVVKLIATTSECLRDLTEPLPRWFPFLLMIVDIYEKACVVSKRKAPILIAPKRVWKWFDDRTGKWNSYTPANNKTIDDAYFAGEQNVRFVASRRHYNAHLNTMVQVNEETGNWRPIMLVADVGETNSDKNVCKNPGLMDTDDDEDIIITQDLSSSVRSLHQEYQTKCEQIRVLEPIHSNSALRIVRTATVLLNIAGEPDMIHAFLRLCLRLTRNYKVALAFAETGAQKLLLNMKQSNSFIGYSSLVTLLFRHIIEDPVTIGTVMEKVVKAATVGGASSLFVSKEMHYIFRVLGPAACRDSELFAAVAKNTLRIALLPVSKREEEDNRYSNNAAMQMLKSIFTKSVYSLGTAEVNTIMDAAETIISNLMDCLVAKEEISDASEEGEAGSAEQAAEGNGIPFDIMHNPEAPEDDDVNLLNLGVGIGNVDGFNDGTDALGCMREGSKSKKSSKDSETPRATPSKGRILTKSVIFRILAELVQSYPVCAKTIVEYQFSPENSELITETCTALSFILDNLLHSTQTIGDKDCPVLSTLLIAAIAANSQNPDTQSIIVHEVKSSLTRAVQLPESADKHSRIQALTRLISIMIESCPSVPAPNQVGVRPQQPTMNNIVKILVRRSLVVDLSRISHHLDLSSPHTPTTLNSSLKPLETLTRIVNLPTGPPLTKSPKTKSSSMSDARDAVEAMDDEPVHVPCGRDPTSTPNVSDPCSAAQMSIDQDLEGIMHDIFEAQGTSEDPISISSGQQESSDSESNPESCHSRGEDDAAREERVDEDEEEEEDDEDVEIAFHQLDTYASIPLEEMFSASNASSVFFGTDNMATYPIPVVGSNEDTNGSASAAPPLPPAPRTLTTTHPLLVRHGDVQYNFPARMHRRQRAYRPNISNQGWHVYSNGNPPSNTTTRQSNPPAILQRLLGPTTAQDFLHFASSLNSHPTTTQTRVVLANSDLRIFSADDEVFEVQDQNGIMAPFGNGSLSNLPTTLSRWTEEARALDGDSIHDTVTGVKPAIVKKLESYRDDEILERKEKRKKAQEDEAKKNSSKQRAKSRGIFDSLDANSCAAADHVESAMEVAAPASQFESNISSSRNPPLVDLTGDDDDDDDDNEMSDQASVQAVTTIEEVMANRAQAAAAQASAGSSTSAAPPIPSSRLLPGLDGYPGIESLPMDTSESSRPTSSDFLQMSQILSQELQLQPHEHIEIHPLDDNNSDSTSDEMPERGQNEPLFSRHSIDPSIFINPAPPLEDNEISIVASTSTQTGASERISSNLGEIPEGVDPSFLAALPDNIRQEVISEQLRLQRLRQRSMANNGGSSSEGSSFTEVNPEFLAALPPNIQEEVLAQQRAEQQRLEAQNSNPDAPVDPTNFIQTLPQGLRQQVLADMDDSLLALLPPEVASEAHTLRREVEARHRRFQEQFFSSHAGSALSRILRTAGRVGRYAIHTHTVPHRAQWPWNTNLGTNRTAGPPSRVINNPAVQMRLKGKLMVDHDALACLLVQLFIDDTEYNATRLHRVLRNLCHHAPTRNWIVKSLLSILELTKDYKQAEEPTVNTRIKHKKPTKGGVIFTSPTVTTRSESQNRAAQSTWLSISFDAALGCRANVFQTRRTTVAQRRGSDKNSQMRQEAAATAASAGGQNKNSSVTIHPLASPVVYRHVLDTLISLAKSFPAHFLPEASARVPEKKEEKTPPRTERLRSFHKAEAKAAKEAKENPSVPIDSDFWNILLALDSASSSRKGKHIMRPHNAVCTFGAASEENKNLTGFEASPMAHLLSLLSHPVVKRSSVLTDRLLRLLALISLAMPEKKGLLHKPSTPGTSRGHSLDAPQSRTGMSFQEAGSSTKVWVDMSPVGHTPRNPQGLKERFKLAVQVLTSKTCSEDGLEDATSFLLKLSSQCQSTRDIVLQLLMEGAMELGDDVRANICILKRELEALGIRTAFREFEEEAENKLVQKGIIQDRFTNAPVVITAPTKITRRELQLPSMSALTSKTSSQFFFLRVLKVIIQLKDIEDSKNPIPDSDPSLHDVEFDASTSAANNTPTNNTTEVVLREDSSTVADLSTQSDTVPTVNENHLLSVSMDVECSNVNHVEVDPDDFMSLRQFLPLEQLWKTLSECLQDLSQTPDHHAVLVLQPAVEAFFLVHATRYDRNEQKNRREKRASDRPDEVNPANERPFNAMRPKSKDFVRFAETHRTVLNQILRQSSTPLIDGPFSVLVDHTRVLDFDVKRRYFRQELERMDENSRREDSAVHVRRDNVFEDSFRELHRRPSEEWKNRFYIVFEGEEGQDAGGLLREWYTIISREIFNPNYALFTTSPGDCVTYMINPSSHCNSNHLSYFKFVGRVIAKAVYDNKLLECYFTRAFYKHILGKLVRYTDMESEDYTFYQSLVYILENGVEELGYELTFSVEVPEFGVTEIRDLKTNGRNIPVTEETKSNYVHLVCQEKMTGAIRKQLNSFLEGFYEIIPMRLISIFNEQELELLISGLPNIDVEDLKTNTEYHKYQPNSLQVQWFWRALRSFDQADRANFLQFVTGTSKVPLQGFSALEGMSGPQKFQIHRDDRSTGRLPSAHTCFNQLDLPAYETYDKLRSMLLKAIHECSEGFGFA